jgi:hypothetical protein
MDPRIRIRIHPKMSWIRNTGRSGVFDPLGQLNGSSCFEPSDALALTQLYHVQRSTLPVPAV